MAPLHSPAANSTHMHSHSDVGDWSYAINVFGAARTLISEIDCLLSAWHCLPAIVEVQHLPD
eukprot:1690025-Amphidinium_carterae.1